MNLTRRFFPTILIWLLLLDALPSRQALGGYSFTRVADTTTAAPTGTFTDFGVPSINGGSLAFRGSYTGNSNAGIFQSNVGGLPRTIAKRGDAAPVGTLLGFVSDVGISGGVTAFAATYPGGGSGVFTGTGGALTTIAKRGDPAPVGTFTDLISNADISGGVAVFRGTYTGNRSGIFTGSGGALTTVAKSGDAAPAGTFISFGFPAIDGSSTAFYGNYTGGTGVFIGNGGTLTTIVKSGDPAPLGTFGFFYDVAISGGTTAFLAAYSSAKGIFTGSGGILTDIVNVGDAAPVGTFTDFAISPSILGGTVAFSGIYNGGASSGVFTGNGGALVPVLLSGDPLFGSTVSSVGVGGNAFDSDGSLALRYTLADGRTGVAIASVPEPSAAALGACGLLSVALRRRRTA